jgi:uncharacterized membrane protein YkvA (DUF1232 family)
MLAASLAYLVQPKDLLPDDLPGSYGFVDDALLLHEACAISWEISGNKKRAEETRNIFQYIFMFVPDGKKQEFQTAIGSLATTLSMMNSLDPMVAEMTIQILVANPLQAVAPQGQSIHSGGASSYSSQYTNYTKSYRPQYTWQSGSSMGVNFPGGGGVATDGRNIYPL